MTSNSITSLGATLIALTISVSACGDPHKNQNTSRDFDYKSLALQLITTKKLTATSANCLSLEQVPESDSQLVEIYVREKHDSKCPGDPSTEPLLFTIRIDRSSHLATTDANSDTGDFEEIR